MGTQHDIYCSVPKAAAMLGVSSRTLNRLLDQGAIPFIKPSNQRRISRSEVLSYRQKVSGGIETAVMDDPVYDYLAD